MRGLALLAALWGIVELHSISIVAQDFCYDMPVVIVRPLEPFPTVECEATEPRPPRPRCLKNPITVNMDVIDNPPGVMNCLKTNATAQYSKGKMHARGDSSLGLSKHQYGLKFEQSEELLGFPAHRKWVLNGPYIDGSLLRNHLAHWLYRQTGRYSPRTRHFIMYIESENKTLEYRGVYLLIEKISNGKHRLGLAENNNACNASQLNGGWAWQFNPLRYGVYAANIDISMYVNTYGSGQKPVLEYPSGNALTQSMRNYFVDENTGPIPQFYKYLWHNISHTESLAEHIDIGSFVDYMLHTEMSLNQDAFRRSLWFFKDRDQGINAGPVWDLNLAYGIGAGMQHSQDWLYKDKLQWRRLLCNYKVAGLYIQRWKTLRQNAWHDDTVRDFIATSAAPIKRMLKNCTTNWKENDPYCVHATYDGNPGTYDMAVEMLVNATITRMHWMDANILSMYFECNSSTCGLGDNSDLQKYNCAQDPNDNGCLSDPEKYYSAVEMPPIHQPYSGEECNNKPMEEPSFDPCWYSTGTYIQASYLTPFCSGYGRCPGGPNATCICNNKATSSDCSPPPQIKSHSLAYVLSEEYTLIKAITFLGILILTSAIIVVFVCTNRVQSTDEMEDHLLESEATNYGT